MNSKTLAGIGIGIGLSAMLGLALVGLWALGNADDEAPARGPGRDVARQKAMDEDVRSLLVQMGIEVDELSRRDLEELAQAIALARADGASAMELGSMGYARDVSMDDLMLLGAWAQMLGGSGYGGLGYGSTGYAATGYAGSDGSGGDNYYSSRVGTGNYNADNSAGYVYIPGTGSVSYGM